jgi:hypothetical protein
VSYFAFGVAFVRLSQKERPSTKSALGYFAAVQTTLCQVNSGFLETGLP